MSHQDLIEEVALRLGDPTGADIPYKILARLATRAYDRVCRESDCIRRETAIPLTLEADTYDMPDDYLRTFGVVYYDASNNTRTLVARSPKTAVDDGPASLGGFGDGSYYVVTPVAPAEVGEEPPTRSFRLRIWPWKVQNVVYDADTMTTDRELRVFHSVVGREVEVGNESAKFIVPDWAGEAVLLEAVASSAPLPASKIKDQAGYYRQLADRAVREVKRQSTQHTEAQTPVPTRY